MFKVVEVEKVGKRRRETVLYSGDDEQKAQSIAHFETQAYHVVRKERTSDGFTITLKVS